MWERLIKSTVECHTLMLGSVIWTHFPVWLESLNKNNESNVFCFEISFGPFWFLSLFCLFFRLHVHSFHSFYMINRTWHFRCVAVIHGFFIFRLCCCFLCTVSPVVGYCGTSLFANSPLLSTILSLFKPRLSLTEPLCMFCPCIARNSACPVSVLWVDSTSFSLDPLHP